MSSLISILQAFSHELIDPKTFKAMDLKNLKTHSLGESQRGEKK